MKAGGAGAFGSQLKALRESAGFTQEELATIAGLSVHAVSALERGERRRPHAETVRALSAALDLPDAARDALLAHARAPADTNAVEELSTVALPLALTGLLGREADLQELRQWLADPAARLVTLLGPGGVGKTRLALELARAIGDDRGTRVAFVPLAAIRDAHLAACAIAEALGLADISASDLPRRARAACAGHPTLLVLDNVEQIADAAPLIADVLAAATTLRLLVTSRAPLRIRGERQYVVGPLASPAHAEPSPVADLARVPAVRLFVQRVRDVRPDFQLTSDNAPAVTAICRQLDGLPLALELAAPWLKMLTPDELLHRLDENVFLANAGPRDLPERQRTMNATVAWSYQLLNPDGQRAFRRLGTLPGRFSIEAAAAVLGHADTSTTRDDAFHAVAALIDKSLLLRVEPSLASHPLYEMLETVRTYALATLTAAGERDDAMEGLVRHCVDEAGLALEGLVGPAQAQWLDRVRDDLDNYRHALGWLLESGRPAEAAAIAWALWPFWFTRGHAAEGRSWYERTLNASFLPPVAESRALVGAALMCYSQGELALARTRIGRAVAVAGAGGDADAVVALAENLSGRVEHAFGDIAAARAQFARSTERYRMLSIPWGIGSALTGMAAVALTTGDFERAERLLDEATPALQLTGPWFLTLSLNVRALLAVRRQMPETAIAVVRESLARIRDVQDKLSFVHAMAILAVAAALTGDHAWVARILGAQHAVSERTGAIVADTSLDTLRQQAEREARARLGPGRWARAYAAGHQITIDGLMTEIDRALARS